MTNPPKMEKTEFELSSNVHEGGNIVYDESFSPTIKLYYDERKVKDEVEKKIRKKNMEEVEEEKESGEFEPLKFTSYENRG